MRHQDIEPGGLYLVDLAPRGRGGRRRGAPETMKVLQVERDEGYTDSTQYRVTCERALVKGLVQVTVATSQVLEPVADEDGYYAAAWKRSDELGWVHKEGQA